MKVSISSHQSFTVPHSFQALGHVSCDDRDTEQAAGGVDGVGGVEVGTSHELS